MESNRGKSREKQRAIRAGQHIPEYRAEAPLWDQTEHRGPGARKAISNAAGIGLANIDEWGDGGGGDVWNLIQAEKLETSRLDLNLVRGYGTPDRRPRKARVPSGDSDADTLTRALAYQGSEESWRTSQGPSEGRTVAIPFAALDDESRTWLESHPNWWEEPKPDHLGGWGVKPSTTPIAQIPVPGDDWRRSMLDGKPVSLDDWPRPERIHRVYDLNSTAEPVWPDARVKALVCHQ
ncbi:hypothetical protein ABT299_20155 [Spirillospora sp. NPDC000708]